MRISDWSSDLYSSDLRRSRMTAGAKVSRLLALDLGTKTGFAVGTPGCVVTGRWDFSARRFEGGGMRYLRFRRQLDEIHAAIGRAWGREREGQYGVYLGGSRKCKKKK